MTIQTRRFLAVLAVVLGVMPWPAAAQEAVDIGSRRELFVDYYLVDRLEGDAQFFVHEPRPDDVVLTTDAPWEGNTCCYFGQFQDGNLYRMYYRASHNQTEEDTCYAESTDGVNWTKPSLGLFDYGGSKDNNIVWTGEGSHDFAAFKDLNPAALPEERYKAVAIGTGGLIAFTSPDGLRWKVHPAIITDGDFDSQNIAFWDPERKLYVSYFRKRRDGVRDIATATSTDFFNWSSTVHLQYQAGTPKEHLYTNAIERYARAPHLLIGFPTRYNPSNSQVEPTFMSSRDGVNFHRWLKAVIPITAPEERDTNRSNYMSWGLLQLPGNDREMSCYAVESYKIGTSVRIRRFIYRVDGFVSIRSGAAGGELVTKPLRFSGGNLEMNFTTGTEGAIRLEIQDAVGTPLSGFSLAECNEIRGDRIADVVSWSGGSDVSSLAGQTVRLRFVLKDADLYAIRFFSGDPTAPTIIQQPQDVSATENETVTFTVTATGYPAPTCQWKKNGTNISGATSATYSFKCAAVDDGAKFSVVATNSQGSVTSREAVLTVAADTTGPKLLSASAASTREVYAAFDEALDAATANTASNYAITGGAGPAVTAAALQPGGKTVKLTVSPDLAEGVDYTLKVTNVKDEAGNDIQAGSSQKTFRYTVGLVGWWKFDETTATTAADSSPSGNDGTVNGATWATGIIGGCLSFGGSDSSYVEIPNEAAYDLKDAVSYVVWIKMDPSSQSWAGVVTKGDHMNLQRYDTSDHLVWQTKDSPGTISQYQLHETANVVNGQWHHVAVTLDGSEKCIYVDGVLSNSAAATGYINTTDYPILMGKNGAVAGHAFKGLMDDVRICSRAITLEEVQALYAMGSGGPTGPTITQQPQSVTVADGDPATFTVAATGTGTLHYQWHEGGSAISGATSATYTISSTTLARNGHKFHCVVTDDNGSATTNQATLTVTALPTGPTITTQPQDQVVTEGDPASFSITGTGSGTLSYQWYEDGSAIAGATNATYAISSTTLAMNGNKYQCIVTDSEGSATSSSATLTVTAVGPDTDNDGLPDSWETLYGLDPNDQDTDGDGTLDPNEDLDGDGFTNLQECQNGTNPNVKDPPPTNGGTTSKDGGCVAAGPGASNPATVLLLAALCALALRMPLAERHAARRP